MIGNHQNSWDWSKTDCGDDIQRCFPLLCSPKFVSFPACECGADMRAYK